MHRNGIGLWLVLVCAACVAEGERPTTPVATILVDHAGGDAFWADVSPDSTRLAWSRVVDGRAAIFVSNADGSGAVRLTTGIWDMGPVWSPDGTLIAYHGEAPDYDLFVVSAADGEPRQLTSGPAVDFPWYWLPDGTGVVFRRDGEGPTRTLVAPLDGGPLRPVGPEGTGNRFAALSPDGSRVAVGVVGGNGGVIWLHDRASGESTQLTTEGFEDISFQPWSPDGRRVLFESRRTGTRDIWTVDAETGELTQITTDVHDDEEARWSPDGRWIAFRSLRGGQPDLWIVPAEGGTPMRVTDDAAFEDDLEWNPDGRSLVYTKEANSDRLEVLSRDGAVSRTLVEWPGSVIGIEGFASGVTVSPHSSSVIFMSNRSGNFDIWSIPLGGGEPAALTTSPVPDELPQLSPDGASIAFHSHMGGSGDVWVMPAAGGQARQLTDWPSNETEPRWSPDGRTIAFLSDRGTDRLEVWIIPANGGEATKLSDDLGDAAAHRWSPDGSAIFFVGRTPSGSQELYRVPTGDGSPEPLGANRFIGVGDLSPDGSHYAYAAFEGGWAFIEVIPAAGGTPRRLTLQTEGVFQNRLVWSPDGSRIFVQDYVYPDNTFDLQTVTWPGGEWSRFTDTPGVSDLPVAFTPGGEAVIVSRTQTSDIATVSVADLLARGRNE